MRKDLESHCSCSHMKASVLDFLARADSKIKSNCTDGDEQEHTDNYVILV